MSDTLKFKRQKGLSEEGIKEAIEECGDDFELVYRHGGPEALLLDSDTGLRCLKCNGTNVKTERIRFTVDVHDLVVDVYAYAMVCKDCNAPMMDSDMMNDLRRTAKHKYIVEKTVESKFLPSPAEKGPPGL